jgi:hypothetical protein
MSSKRVAVGEGRPVPGDVETNRPTTRPSTGPRRITGPATSLLLVLTRRRLISAAVRDDLQASGNLDLFTHWVENSAHQAR